MTFFFMEVVMNIALNEVLSLSLDIGERMLKCGAEISRVEDTIERIITGYSLKSNEVFVLNSIIIATISNGENSITETRRIKYRNIDLLELENLNDLSRKICSNNISRKEVLNNIESYKKSSNKCFTAIGMMLASSSFTLFFGGTFIDSIVSLVIALVLFFSDLKIKKSSLNNFIYNFFSSFLIGICAVIITSIGIGTNLDKIIIGDIMLLIPGLSTFISINDIFKGDTVSGISRFTEGIFLALVIAGGIGIALSIGGAIK